MSPISRAQARVLRQLKAVRDAEDAEARLAAKTDAFVDNFIHSTPAQVTSYIDANVTDLASAKVVIKKMSLMLLLLARKEYLE